MILIHKGKLIDLVEAGVGDGYGSGYYGYGSGYGYGDGYYGYGYGNEENNGLEEIAS